MQTGEIGQSLKWQWILLCLLCCSSAIYTVYSSGVNTANQLSAFVVLVIANSLVIAWVALDRVFKCLTVSQVLAIATVLAGFGLLSQPLLEDDHFRYLWDGYITATTLKPYAYAPLHYFAESNLTSSMRDVLSGINNPEITTIYGPVLQAIFAVSYLVEPAALWPIKLVLFAAYVVIILLLARQGLEPRWLLLFAVHPLVLKESLITAHPDILLGAALLGAVVAWQNSNESWAAILVSIAVAIKVSALVVLPFFCIDRHGRFTLHGFCAMVLALICIYAPLWLGTSTGEAAALFTFAREWTFNPLLYKVFLALTSNDRARIVTSLIFALIWSLLYIRWIFLLRNLDFTTSKNGLNRQILPPVAEVLFVLLVLSPVVNPWYWLWILPLAALKFSVKIWVMATISMLAYTHFYVAAAANSALTTFAVPSWATYLQLLALASVIIFEYCRTGLIWR